MTDKGELSGVIGAGLGKGGDGADRRGSLSVGAAVAGGMQSKLDEGNDDNDDDDAADEEGFGQGRGNARGDDEMNRVRG